MEITDGIEFQDETLNLLNGRNSGLSEFYNIIRMIGAMDARFYANDLRQDTLRISWMI
jgi:hypothetical protein